jgi:TolB-like protein
MRGMCLAISGRSRPLPARFLVMSLIGWWCLGVGCVPSKVQIQAAPQFEPSRISSLAILPFQTIKTPQLGSSSTRGDIRDPPEIRSQFQLPGTDQVHRMDSKKELYVVPATAAHRITNQVVSALSGRPSLRVIDPEQSSAVLGQERPIGEPWLVMAQEVGTQLQVDGVLTGLVSTYREREGSSLGANPAAVGFEVYLVRPSDGTILWTGEFFEEQKPFNQDVVGFFEKGGGFVTADKLAELGVQKVMKAFPVGLGEPGPRLPPPSLKENP